MVLPPPRRQIHACRRYARLGVALCPVCLWQRWLGGGVVLGWHPAPRHLLRLLLCDGSDLHRSKGPTGPACRGTGADLVHHLWSGYVCRIVAFGSGGRSLRAAWCRRSGELRLALYLALRRRHFSRGPHPLSLYVFLPV